MENVEINPQIEQQPRLPKTPAIRLSITIREDKEGANDEIITKVTSGREHVLVDGLSFKRKRKLGNLSTPRKPIDGDGTPAPKAKQPRLDGGETPQETGCQSGGVGHVPQEPVSTQTEEERELEAAAQEILAQIPEDFSPEDRFMAICELTCQQEIEAAEVSANGDDGTPLLVAVRAVLDGFIGDLPMAVNQLLAERAAAAAAAKDMPPEEPSSLGVELDLAARKANLKARLAAFEEEERQWLELLNQSQADPAPEAPKEGEGAPEEGPEVAAGSPQAAADVSVRGPRAAAALPAPSAVPAASSELEMSEMVLPDTQPAPLGLLEKAQAETHQTLTMQVESLCMMVGGVEELIAKTNQHSAALQVEYHQKNFQAFPQVHSPAALIKAMQAAPRLTPPPQPTARQDPS